LSEIIDPVYSVDKIRLKSRILKEIVWGYMKKYNIEPCVNYWEEFKMVSYRHNWRFKVGDEQTIYIGCQHNSEQPTDLKCGVVIEYNPNKLGFDNKYLDRLLMLFSKTEPVVQKIDVAVDFHKVNIDLITILKGNKRKIITLDYGADDKTFYLGESGQNGRVKVYNKAKERSKKRKGYQVPYDDWTRYEITLKPDVITSNIQDYKIEIDIPNITYISSNEIKSLNSTDRILLKAIKVGLAGLTELSRKKRDKLRPFVEVEYKRFVKKHLLENAVKEYVQDLVYKYFFFDNKQYVAAHYSKCVSKF